MRFQKIPYYLRKSIDEIVQDARQNITIHYVTSQGHGGQNVNKVATCCQITDHNDYAKYFFEPIKFEIPEAKVIKCMDQRSAHQNGVIAIKRWEKAIKEFLEKPAKKKVITNWDIDLEENNKEKDEQKSWEKVFHHPTPENNFEILVKKTKSSR
ncbi:MAG: peptide chain release factor-like protein [Candidatus Gracilibacteria bacterium]|jgi:protein subunit release factor A